MTNISQGDSNPSTLHIYEDDYKIIWAISAFGAALLGVFLLNITFGLDDFFFKIPIILVSLGLFSFTFYAAFKAAEDLYEIILHIESQNLFVNIAKKGEIIKRNRFPLYYIECLMIEHKIKSQKNEAAYDYTTNYYIRIKLTGQPQYLQLININEDVVFALKLEDAEQIIQYIIKYNPAIDIKSTELEYLNQEKM